jgi:F-type H+-transporting ATPase subunit delta
VTNRTAARRYARALEEVALKEKVDLQTVEAQLSFVADLFTQHAALEKVMLNPAVPAPRKRGAMEELTRRATTSPIVSKLLALLAERDRLVLLPELLAAFRERLLDHQQVIRAEVTSAAPLEPDRAKAIERSLATVTGRTVKVGTRVDPSIIGGVVARVGDTIYDASVATQLRKMKKRLTEGARG